MSREVENPSGERRDPKDQEPLVWVTISAPSGWPGAGGSVLQQCFERMEDKMPNAEEQRVQGGS